MTDMYIENLIFAYNPTFSIIEVDVYKKGIEEKIFLSSIQLEVENYRTSNL